MNRAATVMTVVGIAMASVGCAGPLVLPDQPDATGSETSPGASSPPSASRTTTGAPVSPAPDVSSLPDPTPDNGAPPPAVQTGCDAKSVDTGERDDAGRPICTPAPGVEVASSPLLDGPPLSFRSVIGWPIWRCADLGALDGPNGKDSQSVWYLTKQGFDGRHIYRGSCASLSSDPKSAEYKSVAGWPAWLCADVPEGDTSMWFLVENGIRTAAPYGGVCASYER